GRQADPDHALDETGEEKNQTDGDEHAHGGDFDSIRRRRHVDHMRGPNHHGSAVTEQSSEGSTRRGSPISRSGARVGSRPGGPAPLHPYSASPRMSRGGEAFGAMPSRMTARRRGGIRTSR